MKPRNPDQPRVDQPQPVKEPRRVLRSIRSISATIGLVSLPLTGFASADPFNSWANYVQTNLFGTGGVMFCTAILAGTFVMAKIGKASWPFFLIVLGCVAGYFGAGSIVSALQGGL